MLCCSFIRLSENDKYSTQAIRIGHEIENVNKNLRIAPYCLHKKYSMTKQVISKTGLCIIKPLGRKLL